MRLVLPLLLVLFGGLAVPVHATNNEIVGEAIRALFHSGGVDTGSANVNRQLEQVRAYYETRSYKPVWARDDGPKSKAKALLEELKASAVHGLKPKNYNVGAIESLMDSQMSEDLARLDMLLSGAVVEYGGDLRNGRIGRENPEAFNGVRPIVIEPKEYIEGAADAGNFRQYASGFLNADERYVRMIAKLAELQRIQSADLWPAITEGPLPDSVRRQIDKIRALLLLTGDMSTRSNDEAHLEEAVRRFQQRHGLAASGEIDHPTLLQMTIPAQTRSEQILVNLERRRWQNRDLQDDHVYINLADRTARVVVNGETSHFAEIEDDKSFRQIPTVYGSVKSIRSSGGKAALEVVAEYADTAAGWPAKFGITLSEPVPEIPQLQIFVTYITAWVGSDGRLHFRDDPLQRDDIVARLLELR
jgi:L,D-transpeptidase YcbB